jgi:hypothetical protein
MNEGIKAMNDTTDLEQTTEETLTYEEGSDEALEAAAGGLAGMTTMIYNPTYGCC